MSTGEIKGYVLPRLPATAILSEEIVSPQGQRIGFLKELMIDIASGNIAYAVVSVGGLFGIGSRLYAVPWIALERRTHFFVLNEVLSESQALDDVEGDGISSEWLPSQEHAGSATLREGSREAK